MKGKDQEHAILMKGKEQEHALLYILETKRFH